MILDYAFTKQKPILSYTAGQGVCKMVLWAQNNLPFFENRKETPLEIALVIVESVLYTQVGTLAELKNWPVGAGTRGAWVQINNILYIRFYKNHEYLAAYDWNFKNKQMQYKVYFTDGAFLLKQDGTEYKHAVTSKYTMKLQGDTGTYEKVKFSSFTLSAVRALVPDGLAQSIFQIYRRDTGAPLDFLYITKTSENIDTVKITGKDIRSLFSSQILLQKYGDTAESYKDGNINIMVPDTLKEFKKEAFGYCRGVVADCLDGYAMDRWNYRTYRAAYGTFVPDEYDFNNNSWGVEVEQDSGWKPLPRVSAGSSGGYWLAEVSETDYFGNDITTTVVRVRAEIAHPPQAGYLIPDYNSAPRKLRFTGHFNTQGISEPTMLNIFNFIIEKYSILPYLNLYFNIAEITAELGRITGTVGLAVTEETELYEAIALLQNGGTYGWKFASYLGKITVRLDDPAREKIIIPKTDVANIEELNIETDKENFVTELLIDYNKNYSEDSFLTFRDTGREIEIKSKYLSTNQKNFETLLWDESAARERFERYASRYNGTKGVITGVKLTKFNYAFSLREYSTIQIDLSPLTNSREWYITNLTADLTDEKVQIDIAEA